MKIRKTSLAILFILLLTGCGKSYTDYPEKWISQDKCIQINPKDCTATIDYPQIEKDKVVNIFSHGNKKELSFCYGEKIGDGDPANCIWEAEAEITDDKLYLKIVKDNVTGLEGKTIVLEQMGK